MSESQEQMIVLMREILQEDFTEMQVRSYTMREDLENESCVITCNISSDREEFAVEGRGVGAIDALFAGLRTKLGDDHPSLQSIRFSIFTIQGLFSLDATSDDSSRTEAEATVGILNSHDAEFVFKARHKSVFHAAIQATLRATEFFVNSEKTFVRLHEILEHYRSVGRNDLIEKYTELMTRVVKNTSYSAVVERIRTSM
jgi:hypothetical protein